MTIFDATCLMNQEPQSSTEQAYQQVRREIEIMQALIAIDDERGGHNYIRLHTRLCQLWAKEDELWEMMR